MCCFVMMLDFHYLAPNTQVSQQQHLREQEAGLSSYLQRICAFLAHAVQYALDFKREPLV